LSRKAGIGTALSRWEKFRFNPRPTLKELEAMSKLIGVEVNKLSTLRAAIVSTQLPSFPYKLSLNRLIA
jgi:hypothetical protein